MLTLGGGSGHMTAERDETHPARHAAARVRTPRRGGDARGMTGQFSKTGFEHRSSNNELGLLAGREGCWSSGPTASERGVTGPPVLDGGTNRLGDCLDSFQTTAAGHNTWWNHGHPTWSNRIYTAGPM